MQTPSATTQLPKLLIGIALLFRIGTFFLWPTILIGILALCIFLATIMIEEGRFNLALVIIPIVATGICIYGAYLTLKEVTGRAFAVPVQLDTYPALWSFVTQVADSVGSTRPDHIIIGMEANFYVTQSPMQLVPAGTMLKGRTLYMSAPLLRTMDKREVEAILAHEFSHFTGSDTIYASQVAPTYQSLQRGIASIRANMSGYLFLAFLIPLIVVWSYKLGFAVIDNALSRSRELRCDEIASRTYGQPYMAAALVKVVGYSIPLLYINDHFANLIQQGVTFTNYPGWFGQNHGQWEPEIREIVAEAARTKTKALDSHPALRERLAALGITPDEAEQHASSGASFNEHYDITNIEELLTEDYGNYVAAVMSAMAQAEGEQPPTQ